MATTETLKARVEKDLARKVHAWAKDHGTDVSETIRVALQRLVDERERERKLQAALRHMKESEALGVYDPPPDDSEKAKGGWR